MLLSQTLLFSDEWSLSLLSLRLQFILLALLFSNCSQDHFLFYHLFNFTLLSRFYFFERLKLFLKHSWLVWCLAYTKVANCTQRGSCPIHLVSFNFWSQHRWLLWLDHTWFVWGKAGINGLVCYTELTSYRDVRRIKAVKAFVNNIVPGLQIAVSLVTSLTALSFFYLIFPANSTRICRITYGTGRPPSRSLSVLEIWAKSIGISSLGKMPLLLKASLERGEFIRLYTVWPLGRLSISMFSIDQMGSSSYTSYIAWSYLLAGSTLTC